MTLVLSGGARTTGRTALPALPHQAPPPGPASSGPPGLWPHSGAVRVPIPGVSGPGPDTRGRSRLRDEPRNVSAGRSAYAFSYMSGRTSRGALAGVVFAGRCPDRPREHVLPGGAAGDRIPREPAFLKLFLVVPSHPRGC